MFTNFKQIIIAVYYHKSWRNFVHEQELDLKLRDLINIT